MVRESASGVVLKLWVSDPSKLISFPRQWAVVTLPGMCTLTLKFIRTLNSIVFYVEAVNDIGMFRRLGRMRKRPVFERRRMQERRQLVHVSLSGWLHRHTLRDRWDTQRTQHAV